MLRSLPHLLFILVDDLGHGNVGFHRSETEPPPEVATPHMDALVADGMMLQRHYVFKMCTPSRSSFLSGRFPVHVTQKLREPEEPNAGVPRNMTGIGVVLKAAGYATHQVGKWDAGMATPTHTPKGRGFDTSLGYFEHKNDFWTKGIMQSECLKAGNGSFANLTDLWDTDGPGHVVNGEYEEATFRDRVITIVQEHDAKARPLFLLYTPHVAHCPLQAPEDKVNRFFALTADDDEGACKAQTQPSFCPLCEGPLPDWPAEREYQCRGLYSAMVSFLDDSIGSLVGALKDKGMYNDALIALSSDNGGPIGLQESGSNNWPLRGGKYADLEGGVRATAFVSGGLVPAHLRGSVSAVVMHIADWYATFAALAGLPYPSDALAAASALPAVDSVNAWPALIGEAAPRTHDEIPLSSNALLDAKSGLKWIKGNVNPSGWQGPRYPNASSHAHDPNVPLKCGEAGCLFNVTADPHELHDLAAEMPDAASAMSKRLAQLAVDFFDNSDVGVDACPPGVVPEGVPCACWLGRHHYGGNLGPFQEIEVATGSALQNGYRAS